LANVSVVKQIIYFGTEGVVSKLLRNQNPENEFSPLHEENSWIIAINLWGERKEIEKKGELNDRDWKNLEN
jgi:hypothetical protein